MKKDDFVVVEKEVRSKDLLKRMFNKAERGARGLPKRVLLDSEAMKLSKETKRKNRSQKDKETRAYRRSQGLCTRCGLNSAIPSYMLCDECQTKGRKYEAEAARRRQW